jgi:hypothetical protein
MIADAIQKMMDRRDRRLDDWQGSRLEWNSIWAFHHFPCEFGIFIGARTPSFTPSGHLGSSPPWLLSGLTFGPSP